jgi:hypothetical protein
VDVVAIAQRIAAERLHLVALNATATVKARYRPGGRARHRRPRVPRGADVATCAPDHAAHALGLVSRCCGLLKPSVFDDELERCRAELDRFDPETIESARAHAGELALRAAGALMVSDESRSLLASSHAQRLVREALFVLVYALRPGSRVAALERLAR